MENKLFTYDEAVDRFNELYKIHIVANPEDDTNKNLKVWCETHDISYQAVVKIRSKKYKRYPKILVKMYQALNIEVEHHPDTFSFKV